MSEDVDLYDDLPVLSFGESVSKIDEERQYFKKQLDEKEKDLHEVRELIAHLEKENKTLEENLSSLYKTAVNEIKRKDHVIEELRREKESLIFRRKGRQNPSISPGTSVHTECLGKKQHQVSGLPAKRTLTSVEYATEESVKLSIPSNDSKVCQRTLESKYYKSTSDVTVSKESNEYLSKCSEISVPLQHETGDSCNVRIKDNNIKQSNPVSHENNCSKPDDALSSCTFPVTHHTHQSESREQLRESLLSHNENEKRSLSSEDRERRHVERGYDSEKYVFSRSRHRSPHNRHRSSRSQNENRRDWSWDRIDDRKFQRDLYKETDFRECKLSMGTGDSRRRMQYTHYRRSRSPQSSKSNAHSPVQRYSDRQHVNSKGHRNIKLQSENVRLATQLKSKYSRAMHERSISRTPVKQQASPQVVKLGSNSQSLQLQDISQKKVSSRSKLNSEKQIVSVRHVDNDVSGSENSTETVLKNCMSDSIGKEYGEALSKDSEQSLENFVVQYNSVKKKKLHPDSQMHENVRKETFEEFRPVSIDIEPNSCVSSGNTSRISKRQSFLKESEGISPRKKASSSEELPSQSLSTPPSKNLIPLKISPSFEDPAIIKENKFSFCVFNEQCEFRRTKRKRSVKLLVTEIKNVCATENNMEERNEPYSVHSYGDDFSKKPNTFSKKQSSECSSGQCIPDEKTCRTLQNVSLRNEIARNQNNNVPKIQGTDTINAESEAVTQEKATPPVEDAITSSDLKTVKISSKLSEIEALKNKSPNKKRKLDSICEELKANLEKKNITSQIEIPLGDSINIPSNLDEPRGSNIYGTNKYKKSTSTVTDADNCEVISGDTVKSNQPLKRIIVSRRRRKVPNLQDNVVQVLSQVKSRIS